MIIVQVITMIMMLMTMIMIIWKTGNRGLTAGKGYFSLSRIKLIYTDLMLTNLSKSDAGSYKCEVRPGSSLTLK